MNSKKESQFTAVPDFSPGDLVTGLRGAGNVNFPYSALFAAMSGLSSLNQVGDPLGAPILDQPGAGVNNFRNIESSKGIIAAVSAQDGVVLGANFVQSTTGSPIIKDLNALQYQIRSLVGGSDINIAPSPDGNSLVVSFVGGGTSTKTVVVSQESDLPVPVAGIITLADDTDYLFVQDLTTSNRFVKGDNQVLRAADSSIVKLTYTGVDTMFTSVDKSNKITKIKLNAPNGKLFDITATSPGKVFQFVNATVESCDTIGTIGSMTAVQLSDVAWNDNITDGLLLTGSFTFFFIGLNIVTQNSGDFLDLGTATFDGFTGTNIFATLAGGTSLLKGAASSANINSGGLGVLENTRKNGAGSILSGITVDDARWNFAINDDIPDTRPDGLLSMQGNVTNTVISGIGTPVLVAGAWVVDSTSQMIGTTAGRLTYNGGKNAKLPITSSVTVSPISGGTISVSAEIAINGTVVSGSKRSASTSAGGSSSITIPWQFDFATTNFVEVFVTNEDSTVDLLVSSAIHRVN